jgi:glycosyltransferase involved in cell wall biosynthesis
MLAIHRALGTWARMVDVYIALTEFARRKFIEGGLPAERIMVKPNFVTPDPGVGSGRGGYALFVGRLAQEKGLDTLLGAWRRLGGTAPLKIVGDGPLASAVAADVRGLAEVQWVGRQAPDQVRALMKEALVLIFPSRWYEGFPMVIVEAFAIGLPVVASRLGSMSSLIEHGRTGLHFRPGDEEDLAAQVAWAFAHPAEVEAMRGQTRREFEARYTADHNYEALMEIYQAAIRRAREREGRGDGASNGTSWHVRR